VTEVVAQPWNKRLAIVLFALYAASVVYIVFCVLAGIATPHWVLTSTTLLFFGFAVTHAAEQLGARSMLVFLGVSFFVSFGFETVGVLTGVIYGPYYYTDKLGPKLGVVPFLIPLAWFMMMYASYAIVRAICGETRKTLFWTLWFALLGAMTMTAWDLGMDPQMVRQGHWVWTAGGAYFGIPVHNFLGWLLTTFVVFLLYRWYENTQAPRGWQFDEPFALLPIAAYAAQGLATIVTDAAIGMRAPALIAFFAMGAFLLSAVSRLASKS